MNRAEERGGMQASRLMPIALLGTLSIICLDLDACSAGQAAEPAGRPDVVAIHELASLGTADRPSVQFPHDLHTGAMKERNEDCTICHRLQEDKRLSPKFQRLDDLRGDELLDLYHDNCIGCHKERAEAKQAGGPVACGDCHRREPEYVSSQRPFGLDKSLHYRHVKAAKEKCDDCHHIYDEQKKTLVYAEGKESSCRDCHRDATEGNRVSFRAAAHSACIGCHRNPPPEFEQKDSPRPQTCAGCHEEEHQLAIDVIKEPPRMKRNQPDFLLLSVAKRDSESSKLRTVPFSHVDHEESTPSCRACHHETLKPCTECHTLAGSEESAGRTLYQAMHGGVAEASCVGCHTLETMRTECAGCHALRERGRLLEESCDTCHAGPLPAELENERTRHTSMEAFWPPPFEPKLTVGDVKLPEIVPIGVLSNQYEPAEMPHGKIVKRLRRHIEESSMAVYFHGRDDVVCQGCHHRSPAGEKPPLCESCHDVQAAGADVHKPGLRGAYHRQCLGCHKSMNIQKPSDCVGCHAEKRDRIAAASPNPDR